MHYTYIFEQTFLKEKYQGRYNLTNVLQSYLLSLFIQPLYIRACFFCPLAIQIQIHAVWHDFNLRNKGTPHQTFPSLPKLTSAVSLRKQGTCADTAYKTNGF